MNRLPDFMGFLFKKNSAVGRDYYYANYFFQYLYNYLICKKINPYAEIKQIAQLPRCCPDHNSVPI